MSLIAEFRIHSPGLVLADALAAVPEMELDLVQEAGTDPERPYLLVWASGDDFVTFEAAMAEDDTVSDVARYSAVDGAVLYRMRITDAAELVMYPIWVEIGAEQLESGYADGWWHSRMRFPDRGALASVESWCADVGIEFDLQQIYTDDPDRPDASTLTDAQREVLAVAYERGYFEIPRKASVEDIAAELGISGQAVSERLRRGHRALVGRHVLSPGP